MNKQAITGALTEHYSAFVGYINMLSTEDYTYRHHQKWTAAEQLAHIVLCIQPLVQVYGMDKAAIAQNFGTTDRTGHSYDELLDAYQAQLQKGGKAPERFVPDTALTHDRAELTTRLNGQIQELCATINTFEEQELDTLGIPHPLLGKLSLREMLYNAIYHVQHHQAQAQEYLKQKNNSIKVKGFAIVTLDGTLIRFGYYLKDAPVTSGAFAALLPFSRTLFHARISGQEIWTDDVPSLDIIQENASVFTETGEVVFGPAQPARAKTANCMGIYYGEGKGLDCCNIFAKVVDEDLPKLKALGEHIWKSGQQVLTFQSTNE
jgi:hypothetical protein